MLAQKWPWGCREDMGGKIKKALCPREPPVGKQLKKFPCTGEGGWWYEAGGMCISSGKEEFSPPILPSGVLWHLAEEDPPPPSLGLAGVG